MVEGASLENWNTGNRIGGSNPSLSASFLTQSNSGRLAESPSVESTRQRRELIDPKPGF